ncbi:hypothetical protein DPX16_12155 [Anabarilius grahami]|uniref:Uncharacterized protein n=1 Tax=Anabarilius grahami TaxID=495550 RepID=A0A3N0YQQ1_ANAGA|nr:hypothetical protein DPX16_12155 [Anabarilius grahami]
MHCVADVTFDEGHIGVKTIMAAILKSRSKSKLATSKGPHDPLHSSEEASHMGVFLVLPPQTWLVWKGLNVKQEL